MDEYILYLHQFTFAMASQFFFKYYVMYAITIHTTLHTTDEMLLFLKT